MTFLNSVKKSFQYGTHTVTLETGSVARQATGAVMVTMGETKLLCTVVGVEKANPNADFFPLTVNYIEKTYAAGKIPGGYFKREAKPTERETLIARLIDRPLRPLFPEGFKNEVQIIITLMSLDPEVSPDVPALIGAAASLAISGIPFNGPVGAARVGYKDGNFMLNPNHQDTLDCDLDLVVAGTQDAVLMVESEAKILPENVMLDAVMFGHEHMQASINAINELKAQAGKPAWDWQAPVANTALITDVTTRAEAAIRDAYTIQDKIERKAKLGQVYDDVIAAICPEDADEPSSDDVSKILAGIEKKVVRGDVLSGKPRIDGRDTRTVRPIDIKLGEFPSVHGSAIFTRGETQAIVMATLGTERDAQIVDVVVGESKDNFMLHYNFPPFCVGEAGFMGAPKRRELGHGKLAKRALGAVVPSLEEFPYVLRSVAEITESNGSSSMATVCGTSLAFMDAGVPMKAPVAGIAMGLVKEGDNFAVLTDILGDEDHLGDMDFKVAGTAEGVTALQMDIKINGITREIMQTALDQAKEARMHILGEMAKVITESRADISDRAPRIITIKIHPDKIRDVIGKGGATIREITESTDTTIDIDDDGLVKIAAVDGDKGKRALQMVKDIVTDIEVGQVYTGPVIKLLDFGAIVEVLPGKTGMVHISQITQERVENIEDYLKIGQEVTVKCTDIDRQGRVRLSMKEVEGMMSS